MTDSEKAWAIANVCLQQGRITSASHAQHIRNATVRYEATVAALAALPLPAASTAEDAPQAAWDFGRLRQEAPAVLEKMQADEPARYAALKDLYVAGLRAGRKPATPAEHKAAREAEQQTWGFDRLRREAPAALEKIRTEDPARYKQLKEAHVATLTGK